MKSFILKEILIMSRLERKAKRVEFHPQRTIILGRNDTGKSSLIKSIYSCLGATAAKENNKWKALAPILLLRFSVGGILYSVLRDGKHYSVFDTQDKLIKTFDSVTTGLGPFLASIFNFKLKLPNQKGELITPPPAFCLLPFYIDQDISWQSTWASFKGLQQIKSYKKPIIEYHTGLRPNEFYETKSEFEQFTAEIEQLDKERKLSKKVLDKIKEKFSNDTFDIDIDSFEAEIKELLVECQKLKGEQEKHKSRLLDLYNNKINLESQIIIASKAINELEKDFQFANSLEDDVECPTCGAHYDNSFSERFNIAVDEQRTEELLYELKDDLLAIKDKISSEEAKFRSKSEEIERIEVILEEKQGQVKLKDIIEKEGKRELQTVFNAEIKELEDSIGQSLIKQSELKSKLAGLDDKKRKEEIRDYYKRLMRRNLNALDIYNLSETDYGDLTKSINNTGSAGARMLVAYYFAIYQVIEKYSSSIYCPIIIDSPNQQAQDQGHIDKIYNFIKENQPDGSQLILGLEELYNVDFAGKVVELKDKYQLLNEDDYKVVYPVMNRFIEQTYSSNLFS